VEWTRRGATLILGDVHSLDEKVGHLAASLSSELGEPVRINLYFSQPSHQGFNRHYDTHDVFILQLDGYKGWKLFDCPVNFPLFDQKEHQTIAPEISRLECRLEPGDVLYIPRGYWHEAVAQTEPSLHLTVGIYVRTGVDFLNWLADEFREDERWRESFPLVLHDPNSIDINAPQSWTHHFEKLKSLLLEKISEGSVIDAYRRFCIAQDQRVKPFNYPFGIQKDVLPIDQETRFLRPAYQRAIISKKDDTGNTEVVVWGKVLHFKGPVGLLLDHIFTSINFSGTELLAISKHLAWEDVEAILGCLVKEGIVEIDNQQPIV
jgi:hypothetical protein